MGSIDDRVKRTVEKAIHIEAIEVPEADPKKKKGKKKEIRELRIDVRLNQIEMDAIETAAANEGLSVSGYVRRAIRKMLGWIR